MLSLKELSFDRTTADRPGNHGYFPPPTLCHGIDLNMFSAIQRSKSIWNHQKKGKKFMHSAPKCVSFANFSRIQKDSLK